MGLDPLEAMVCDSIKHGVLEPAMTKLKIIQVSCPPITPIHFRPTDDISASTILCLQFGASSSVIYLHQFATKAAIGILQSEDVIWLAKEGSSEDDDDK